jgi:Tfp pilus assembly protein FimT
MNKQCGYTLTELLALLVILFWLAILGAGIWAVCHFVAKFW